MGKTYRAGLRRGGGGGGGAGQFSAQSAAVAPSAGNLDVPGSVVFVAFPSGAGTITRMKPNAAQTAAGFGIVMIQTVANNNVFTHNAAASGDYDPIQLRNQQTNNLGATTHTFWWDGTNWYEGESGPTMAQAGDFWGANTAQQLTLTASTARLGSSAAFAGIAGNVVQQNGPTRVMDAVRASSFPFTVTDAMPVVLVDNGAVDQTINLPAISAVGDGHKVTIKTRGSTQCTLDANGTDTVRGAGTSALAAGTVVTLMADAVASPNNWEAV